MSRDKTDVHVERMLYSEAMGRCMNPECHEELFINDGNLQFKELRLIGKIKVFQMFREAITTYKDKLSIEELSDIKKSITGEQEND